MPFFRKCARNTSLSSFHSGRGTGDESLYFQYPPSGLAIVSLVVGQSGEMHAMHVNAGKSPTGYIRLYAVILSKSHPNDAM